MQLQTKNESKNETNTSSESNRVDECFSKDYVDFLNEAGWTLEKKLPSNRNNYSDLLEDTEWKTNDVDVCCPKHYRRDLDALS